MPLCERAGEGGGGDITSNVKEIDVFPTFFKYKRFTSLSEFEAIRSFLIPAYIFNRFML